MRPHTLSEEQSDRRWGRSRCCKSNINEWAAMLSASEHRPVFTPFRRFNTNTMSLDTDTSIDRMPLISSSICKTTRGFFGAIEVKWSSVIYLRLRVMVHSSQTIGARTNRITNELNNIVDHSKGFKSQIECRFTVFADRRAIVFLNTL